MNLNFEQEQMSENLKNKKRIQKAINLIDDFVTKFISKIEYYKMTLESQLNQAKIAPINLPSLEEKNNIETNIKYKEANDINDINEINEKNNNNFPSINNNNNNNDDEYLNNFIKSKNFYKKALYLLFLISEDKFQIQKLIERDKSNIEKENDNNNNISCIKEINKKNFINSISYLKNEKLISLGMYNFFEGSSIDLYSLDLKLKLSIKKLGSNIYEIDSGGLATCSYNSINIIKLETNNNEHLKYKVIQTLKGKSDSGEILGVLELNSVLISYDWNHILLWKKCIQNNKKNKKNENNQILKFKEFKSSNFGSDYLIKINDKEFISHEKGNILAFYSLDKFDSENRIIIKNINSIGDSMCLIDNNQILIIGGNENGLLYIISIEKKEIITSIKINDISNYSINRICFYENNNKMYILCAGGYNLSDKNVTSDIINISFNINRESNQLFNIEEQNIIKNAHNSWITGLLMGHIFDEKNKSCFIQSNLLKDEIFFFSTSHDKK